ncbi:hypothetical protein F5Y05DRAFT_424641 [Hypoxylon sp. FL0543]|nr:hypothetical protein F5Y05DRAFT_424641 [Hypoxylon sp. FL0543]
MGKPRLRRSSPVYLNSSPTELTPPSSILEDWDQETATDMSRPTSLIIPRTGSPFANPPSLTDILSNTAPPPWTLSSFMAFLSQNHCLETLEFILDAERYRTAYYQIAQGQSPNGPAQICSLWRKVIDAYIMPCAPREVNLPADVRDRLLELPCCKTSPPHPSELDEAVHIVRELINDSVLVPFLESMVPTAIDSSAEAEALDPRQGRSRLRIPRDLMLGDDSSQSPRSSYLPLLFMGRSGAGNRSTTASMETVDVDMMTDDSCSPNSTFAAEPMTPPTTPPNSDLTYNTSPSTLQRAISGNGWKKMGAKLGLTKKSKSTRRTGSTQSSSTLATHEAADLTNASWQDPHPGERLQIPLGLPARMYTYPQTISGDATGGVAVKARKPYCENGPLMIGRSVRGRQRNAKPKSLKIPAKVLEESDAKSAPSAVPQPCPFMNTFSSLRFLPPSEPLPRLEFETDTETEVGVETGTLTGDADTDHIKSTAVSQTHLSDFSNYLCKSRGDEEDDASVTVVGADAFIPTNSVDDAYGWEAELDRKMECRVSTDSACPCRYDYQKPGDGRRSLLHRVFAVPGRRFSAF